MQREYHRWYSHRLGLDMGVVVYGHWGPPLIGFPTSAGDEWELENQGLIGSLADLIDGGRVKIFSVNSVNFAGLYNKGVHPFHRSWMQSQFDAYMRNEVVPFIHDNCKSPGIAISTMGASFGAYHAANTLLKHPDVVRRCFALSGVYDIKGFMDGMYDDNTYFNNPVDYLANISDPHVLGQPGPQAAGRDPAVHRIGRPAELPASASCLCRSRRRPISLFGRSCSRTGSGRRAPPQPGFPRGA